MNTRLYISFKNQNAFWLKETLDDVSNPFSSNYGEYPSFLEVQERTKPSNEMINQVSLWLLENEYQINEEEILFIEKTGYLPITVTVHQAERLLNTNFYLYEHIELKNVIARATSYTIPKNLENIIAFIGGVIDFPIPRAKKSRIDAPLLPGAIVNPAAIRYHYQIPDNLQGKSPLNSQSVAEYENQWYDSDDLSMFFERNNLPDTPVSRVVGFNNNTEGQDGGEADLDIQYLMGIGVNISTWFISLDNTPGADGFLEWIILLLALGDNAPLLQSTSYGANERFISSSYLDRVSEDLMKFGMTGHTIFFSSGDYGVGCNCNLPVAPEKYVAHFPASSPYVTSIGGTISLPTTNGTEIGVSFSGGGFSIHFTRESYQEQAVEAFLNSSTSLPPSSFYNSTNRGYPDMSAWALNYEIYEHGNLDYIGGTSASTPTVAGMFSLINDLRLQNGQPSLGFLNPTLYTLLGSSCYNDMTIGNNGNTPCCSGFSAQIGWDPMTGLGTPNFNELQSFFLQSFPLSE